MPKVPPPESVLKSLELLILKDIAHIREEVKKRKLHPRTTSALVEYTKLFRTAAKDKRQEDKEQEKQLGEMASEELETIAKNYLDEQENRRKKSGKGIGETQ